MDASTRLDAWLERRGVVGTAARDRLLAVLATVVTALLLPLLLTVALATEGEELSWDRVVLLTVLTSLPCLVLVARRSHPVACLLLAAAAQVAVVAVAPSDTVLRGPATVVAAYTVGALLPGRVASGAVLGAALVEAVGAGVVGLARGALGELLLGAAGAPVVYLAAALAGSYVGTRRRYVTLLRQRAEEAEAAQDARVRGAVQGERTRMARELHDVAAHHLSGMVVQAAAVQRLLDRDLDAAREGVASIRGQGRRTLEDLRLLVGVLRDPGAGPGEESAPVPGLAQVADLVQQAQAVGEQVTLEVTGAPRQLAPLGDVTCYRLVQEALSNARQHASGAAVRVRVEHGRAVTVTVENDAAATPARVGRDGVGLTGMRERAQLVGAALEVGPVDGGWRVRAVVPPREGEDR